METTIETCEKHGMQYETAPRSFGGIGCCRECRTENVERFLVKEYRDKEDSRLSRMKWLNIEPMYYDSTLSSYIATTPEQEKAAAAIGNMISTGTGKIVMLGKHGTGKTHLAVAVVRKLGGRILSMYEIGTRIRATYSHGAHEDELTVVDELASLSMLAIDEIGRTKGSDAEANWLSYIIDKRHVRGLPLILISNKHARKACKSNGCADCLENYISEDIMSRLREDGTMFTFSGDDYRVTKRAMPTPEVKDWKAEIHAKVVAQVDEECAEDAKAIAEYKAEPEPPEGEPRCSFSGEFKKRLAAWGTGV